MISQQAIRDTSRVCGMPMERLRTWMTAVEARRDHAQEDGSDDASDRADALDTIINALDELQQACSDYVDMR